MGLKFDPEQPFGLITGDGTEGRYYQNGITFSADGTPINPPAESIDPSPDAPPVSSGRKKS